MKNKQSFKHKLGNFLSGIIKLIDSLIIILTLGNKSSNLSFRFCIFRLKNNFLMDINK